MYLTYLAELYELVNCMYFYYAPGQQLDTFWKMSLGDFAELHVCIKQWLLYKHKFKKNCKIHIYMAHAPYFGSHGTISFVSQ